MPSATAIFTVLAGLVAVLVGAIYVFGIPPGMKRAMEDKALDTMGENKASYTLKREYSLQCPSLDYFDIGSQSKSERSQRRTKRTSRTCKRASETLLVAVFRTRSGRQLEM